MSKLINTRISQKHDFECNWDSESTSIIPHSGEVIIYDSEVNGNGDTIATLPSGRTDPYNYARVKIGDGIHLPKDLPFVDDAVRELLNDKIQNINFSDPAASGSGVQFISSVSQTNGLIKATKSTVRDATTGQKGIVKLSIEASADASTAATPKAIKDAIDALGADAPILTDASTLTVISDITQTNGKINATKKSIQKGTTAQSGVVQLVDAINSTSTSTAATANAVKTAYDTACANHTITFGQRATKADGTATTHGSKATAEGHNNDACGQFSHAEGTNTTASSDCAHSEGQSTTASGVYSHAEGYNTTASGSAAHAEGHTAVASGAYSHAEGYNTKASGAYSHVSGYNTVAKGGCQTVVGKHNAEDTESLFIVGNGSEAAPNNAMRVLTDGTVEVSKIVKVGSAKLEVATKKDIEDLDYTSPSTPTGSGLEFISDVSQTDGKISATKIKVQDASVAKKGVVQLTDSSGTSTTTAATPNAIRKAIEELAFTAPSASGKATSFISSVSQTNGKITATKADVREASTSASGIVQLNDSVTSASTTQAATANAVKQINDKILKLDFTAPTADGVETSFIDTVSQTDGKITATKKTIRSASTSTEGIVKLNDSITSTSTSTAATANAVKQVNDKILKLDFTEPTAEGTDTAFISTVSQTDGKITATKANLPEASTTDKGIVKLNSATTSTSEALAATPKAVNSALVQAKEYTDDEIGKLNAADPTANETSTSFIATVSENRGIISATKKNLPEASTTDKGIVKLSDSSGTSTTTAATPNAIKKALEELAFTAPSTTNDSGLEFISTVSQTNGKIDATKIKVQEGSVSKKGVVQLSDDSSDDTTTAATPNAIRKAIEELAFTAPSASETSTTFIATVSQTDGKISATKANLPEASTSDKGIVRLNDTIKSTSKTQAATANAVKTAYDTACSTHYITTGRKEGTTAGSYSTAEGCDTTASGKYSHAEGWETEAIGACSHAEGKNTKAGYYSHAEGIGTIAGGMYQHVSGRYNVADATSAVIIGNGTTSTNTETGESIVQSSNAHTLDWDGNAWYSGDVKIGGTSYNDENAKTLATREYVDNQINQLDLAEVGTFDGITFIQTISETDGKVSATASRVRNATTTISGVVQLCDDLDNSSTFLAATANAVKTAYDTACSNHYITTGRKANTLAAMFSTAEGYNTTSSALYAHAEGNGTKASSPAAHAEGDNTHALGTSSHTEGIRVVAMGPFAHAEGQGSNNIPNTITTSSTQQDVLTAWSSAKFTVAKGTAAHSEGTDNIAWGDNAHAEGGSSRVFGISAHAEGYQTCAYGNYSHAEGGGESLDYTYGDIGDAIGLQVKHLNATSKFSVAHGNYSHIEGQGCLAIGIGSHAEGYGTIAKGSYSHAEGYGTTASGTNSHAEGSGTTASNGDSHAEGYRTIASGGYSHAEGYNTTASGLDSHAEGCDTEASGKYSHAEGYNTTAEGNYSHAEGYLTTASGQSSHAAGVGTYAKNYQYTIGRKNRYSNLEGGDTTTTNGAAFIIGNGVIAVGDNYSNAFRVDFNGKVYSNATDGAYNSGGADYAELFEWVDSNVNNEDRRGYFITLDGDKIKIAGPDDYILGIISSSATVLGNNPEDWNGRYIRDEFGCVILEEYTYEETITDEETGAETTVTKTGKRYKQNPDYDPEQAYIERDKRPEWAAVGMLGVLSVRDDGTCKVNGYCTVAEGGVATASETGYRVVKRVSENIVKVIFR